MRNFFNLGLMATTALIVSVSSAYADHMTGSYVGSGDATGTNLSIQQNGTTLSGTFTGLTQGSLQGNSDGSDFVRGVVDLYGVGQFQFESSYSDQGLVITLYGNSTSETHTFVRNQTGDVIGDTGSDTYYYLDNGAQVGPVGRTDIEAAIAGGTIARDTMVWVPGQPEWQPAETYGELAALLPPPVEEAKQYYLAIDGQQVGPLSQQELEARIAGKTVTDTVLAWTKGQDAWTPLATFAEFADEFVEPPPPPAETEEQGPPDLPVEEVPPQVEPTVEDLPPPLGPTEGEDQAVAPEADLDVSSVATDEGLAAFWTAALEYSSRAQELSEEQRAELIICVTEVSAKLPAEERIEMVTLLGSGGGATMAEKWPEIPGQLENCYVAAAAE